MNKNGREIIDISSVVAINNRVSLYIDKEEEIIQAIKDTLYNLDSFYVSDNELKVKEKIDNLISNLDIMLNNRREYVLYIDKIVDTYEHIDYQNYQKYRNM